VINCFQIRVDSNAKMLSLPPAAFDPTKSTSFGYGEKNGLKILGGIDSPSPNSYKIRGTFERLRPN
jgi:hypothetical protein